MKNYETLPKLLFFDYDNTIVDSQTHRMPDSADAALKALVQRGHHIAIASGRNYPNLKETGVCDAYPWSGFCLNNGQLVLDAQQQVIHHHFLPPSGVRAAIKQAQALGFNLFFSSPDGDFMLEPTNALVREAHDFFEEPIPEIGVYDTQRIDKMLVYAPLGYDYAPFKAIEGLTTFVSVSTYADLATAGVSKHSAIVELCQHLKLEPIYAAFGDSQNDVEMLTHAALGIAMGNGDPRLKAIADWTTLPVNQDGLAHALKHFGFLD